MNFKNRIDKLSKILEEEQAADIVCFVDITDDGLYEVTVNGEMKILNKEEFEKFQESKYKTRSIFFFNEGRLQD